MVNKIRSLITFLFILTLINSNSAFALSPHKLEKKLLGYINQRDKYENNDERKEILTENFISTLIENGNQQDVLLYDFPKLKSKITSLITSKDKKLRVYSISLGGGTMSFFKNLVQYQDKNGKVYIFPLEDKFERKYSDGPTDSTDFCNDIFQITSEDGPIYLVVSTFVNSTKASGQKIRALKVQDDKLDFDSKLIKTQTGFKHSIVFGYDFFSVVDHPERPIKLVFFNEENRSFQFPVVIEHGNYIDYGDVTDKFLTYRFNGKYFVKLAGTSVRKNFNDNK